MIAHVSRHADILPALIPRCPRSLGLAITLDTADYGRAAMRMQGRRVGAGTVIIDGVDMTIMVAAGRRGAPVKRCDEAVVFHAAFLDAVDDGAVFYVVQLRADEPDGLRVADVHALLDVAGELVSGTAAVHPCGDCPLYCLSQLLAILPDAGGVVFTAPWRPDHVLQCLRIDTADRMDEPAFLADVIEVMIVEIPIG